MGTQRALIVGGGLGGLAAAIELGRRGLEVMVLERAPKVGGKMREVVIDGRGIDSGPTVLTMRRIFDELFEAAGERLDDHVTLDPMAILARHAWEEGGRLDLFADPERSADAIGRFASAADARGYRRFCEHTRRIFEIVEGPFIAAARPTLTSLVGSVGWRGLRGISDVDFHRTMWRALDDFFRDPRLLQLFGRYATYYGSSPFAAPATLNLIAHVEQRGVWTVRGGIYRLAEAMVGLAERQGVVIRRGAEVTRVIAEGGRARALELAGGERLFGDAIVVNADVAAVAGGLFGDSVARAARAPSPRRRSLSALTWSMLAEARGFPLVRHSVFFGGDYQGEFRELFGAGRLPSRPTVYVCAQDRPGDDVAAVDEGGLERLFILVNAPARGGEGRFSEGDFDACEAATFRALERAGLSLGRDPSRIRRTTPDELADRFPATGGAIYGAATHGMTATLRRPGARTRVPGLYLAGGSAHPGAGVPMVTLSGRFAATAVIEDLASTGSRRTAATPGGTSTGSATTGASASR